MTGIRIARENNNSYSLVWVNCEVALPIVLDANSPGAGDGLATLWSFDHLGAGITSIRFIYAEPGTPGNYARDVGWAVDNFRFSAVAVPEPATLTIVGSGLLALIVPTWYRRRKQSRLDA